MKHAFDHRVLLSLSLLTTSAGLLRAQAPAQEPDKGFEAQVEAFNKKSVDELIADLEQFPDWLAVVQRLRVLNDPAAIAPLKRAYQRVEGKSEKQVIAAALLSLGVRDGPYFDLLAKPSLEAARSDIPYPLPVDAQDQSDRNRFAPGFLAWCQERGLDPGLTAQRAVWDMPAVLKRLGDARDPRAQEIFLEALNSPNLSVVLAAIQGLAFLGRKENVERAIRAVERFPPSLKPVAVSYLLLFDDPKAEEYVQRIIPDEARRSALRENYRQRIPHPRPQER